MRTGITGNRTESDSHYRISKKSTNGSPHMAAQKQDDELERTFSSYVRI